MSTVLQYVRAAIRQTVRAAGVISCLVYLYGCSPIEGMKSPEKKSETPLLSDSRDPPADPSPMSSYSPHPAGTLTYCADVAPIVMEKCAGCHRPDEIAPFPLLSYADVQKRALQIVSVTQSQTMPPWSAAPGFCVFKDDRSLTTDQIGVLKQWYDEGTSEGRPEDLPSVPPIPVGWRFGEPDLVVRMAEPYTLPGDVRDTNRRFVIRVPIEELTYIRGWDFDPGNPSVVHHAFLCVDQSGWAQHLDDTDPLPGYDGILTEGIGSPDGFNLVWLPGCPPPPPDNTMAWPLMPGTDLVLELHLCGTGKDETLQPSIALYFSKDPPTSHPGVAFLIANTIDIPPGEKAYRVDDEYELPVDAKLLSIGPHAHYRGKDVQVRAVFPDGTKSWLLRIKDWDFNWQNRYTFAKPILAPKGTVLQMRMTYDNSPENLRNPVIPPVPVRIGRKSSDEMGEIAVYLLLNNAEDAAILRQGQGLKNLEDNLERDLYLVQHEPNNAETHFNLGTEFQAVGNLNKAIFHYTTAIRLDPDMSRPHNNLGSVYRAQGRVNDAIAEYSEAIRIYPDDSRAHYNLGQIFLAQNRLDDAEERFRMSLNINKNFVEAEHILGIIALRKKDVSSAMSHFKRALSLNPAYEPSRQAVQKLGGP